MKSMPSKYRKKQKAVKEWYSKEVITKKNNSKNAYEAKKRL